MFFLEKVSILLVFRYLGAPRKKDLFIQKTLIIPFTYVHRQLTFFCNISTFFFKFLEQSLRNKIDDEIRCLRHRVHHLLDERKVKCDFMLGIGEKHAYEKSTLVKVVTVLQFIV